MTSGAVDRDCVEYCLWYEVDILASMDTPNIGP